MKATTIILAVFLLAISEKCRSQGFLNLDFESAQIPNSTSLGAEIPISEGLPGWSAYFISSTETDQVTQVAYDGISTGGNLISIIDANSGFNPLQGNYSALLTGGGGDQPYSAQISQTGMVPSGTEAIFLEGYLSPSFTVTLGGQTIDMTAVQTFSNYTLYSGAIPSSLAGEVETLSISEAPSPGGYQSYFELDNIQFSTDPAPEPGTLALCALGGLSLALRWRKKSSA